MAKNDEIDIFIDSFDDAVDEYKLYSLTNEKILLCVPKDNSINDKLKEFQILPDSIYNNSIDLDNVKSVSIEIFKNEKFILLKNGNDMRTRAMHIFHENNIEPKAIFNVDQLNISYALVDLGMCVSFITDTFLKYGNLSKNVVLYDFGKEHSNRNLCVAYKRNKYCTRAMGEFISVAKEVIR